MSDDGGRPGYELIAELDAPGSGAWQGACQNTRTGEWFMAHSRGNHVGGSEEDVHIYRFRAVPATRKPYRDQMTLVDGGHVYGFGVSDSSILWTTWDGADGNDVTTITYRPGSTVRKGLATKMHMFTEGSCQVSFSPTRDGLVVMETVPGGYTFTKRLKDDVLNNVDDPRGKVIKRPKPTSTWLQGFSLAGEFLYIAYGKTAERSWIEKWSFATGEKVDVLDVSDAGFEGGSRSRSRSREIEGMDARTFSVKIDHDDDRRLRIYQMINF